MPVSLTTSRPSKAFLSHSSIDKSFVEAVALRLGRVQVVFDQWSFETGDAFIKAIPKFLEKAELFVLFASRASLQSFWVSLEVDHAEFLMTSAALKKTLVFIIDDHVHHSDLPRWMQGALVRKFTSPNAVARDIQAHLDKLRGAKQKEYFFGRDQLLEDFSSKLYPQASVLPPNILIFAGLSGMGRRTFCKKILEERLSLRGGPIFHLKKGDGLDALHIAILLENAPMSSKSQISDEIIAFQQASAEEQVAEVARLLAESAENNVAPMILDDGALVESNGSYTKEANLLVRELRKTPQSVFVFIQTRLPELPWNTNTTLGVCGVRVPPLGQEPSRQFLQRRFADSGIEASQEQIASLLEHLGGFPPAFNMATTYARDYGLPVLLNNKAVLTNFQQQEFADLLQDLNLSNHEWGILRLLASGMEVPIEGLMAALNQPSALIVPAIQRLVDLSLVVNNGGTLAITGPLTHAVLAAKGPIPPNEYAFIGKSLKAEFWDKGDSLPEYGILEATISALLKSNEPDLTDFKQFVVPSMLLRSARYHYQRQSHEHWLTAKRWLDLLLKLEPANVKALALSMRIQVRLRKFEGAESILNQLKQLRSPEVHFLEGFLLWKRKRFEAAIPHFQTALRLGQEAVDIFHGLASCLFRLGKLDEAQKVIQRGLQNKARHNPLLVDLAAQIAIDKNQLDEAEKYVEQLRRLNALNDYHHRQATLLNARHRSQEALGHARKASQDVRARFENKTTYIDILIEVKKFNEAESELDRLYAKHSLEEDRRNVLLGLRCKWLLRQGMWSQAEPIWESLSDKDRPVHLAIRKEILQQKVNDRKLPLTSKNEATLELLGLKGTPDLASIEFSDLSSEDGVDANDE